VLALWFCAFGFGFELLVLSFWFCADQRADGFVCLPPTSTQISRPKHQTTKPLNTHNQTPNTNNQTRTQQPNTNHKQHQHRPTTPPPHKHQPPTHAQAQGPQEPAQEAPHQVRGRAGAQEGPGAGGAGGAVWGLQRGGDGRQVQHHQEPAAGVIAAAGVVASAGVVAIVGGWLVSHGRALLFWMMTRVVVLGGMLLVLRSRLRSWSLACTFYRL